MGYAIRYYTRTQDYWDTLRTSDFELNQYDVKQHEEILVLLKKVEDQHGIPYEIRQVEDSEEKEKVYRHDFLSRSKILKERLGETVARTLRTRSGNYMIARKIAILEDGQVGWVTGSRSSYDQFAPKDYNPSIRADTLYFLEALVDQGLSLLDRLCFATGSDPEQQLIDRFIASGVLNGDFLRNVHLQCRKQVDLICRTPEATWILEAKTGLNWEAFGQVIGYTLLYSVEHPSEKTQCGIVSGTGDDVIEWICKQMGIVFFNEEADFLVN